MRSNMNQHLVASFLEAHPHIKLVRGIGPGRYQNSQACEFCIQQAVTLALRWSAFRAAGFVDTLGETSGLVDDKPPNMWIDIRVLNDLGDFSTEARVNELVPLADAIVRLASNIRARERARELVLVSMVNQFVPHFLPRLVCPMLGSEVDLLSEEVSSLVTSCAEAQSLRAAKRALYALANHPSLGLDDINRGALFSLAGQIHYSMTTVSCSWSPPTFSLYYKDGDNEDDTLIFIARLWRAAVEQAEQECSTTITVQEVNND